MREGASDSVGVMGGLDNAADGDGRVVRPAEEPAAEHATTIANVTQTPAETRNVARTGMEVKAAIHARARGAVMRRPGRPTVLCPSMFSP
ncbi:hypothetical protein Aple_062650 [Acrocarpospora pleiomorpha]|uniref:Uncharacterized protein n=1 Tax=Acrocarpospora pleiomorpha TaxID=90975 RepID=A0A5M3XRG3_9ACTN|nr:hypothetical protein Aple_062650 [Acrocarpospora pleiomorpha]